MKALIIRKNLEYEAVDVEEGYRLVEAGLASWAAGLAPARAETATLPRAETPESARKKRRR